MLHKINEGYVISDDGYKVKLGRHHVTYIEDGDNAITFEAEDMIDPYCLVIYISNKAHYWHPSHRSTQVTVNELNKIKDRMINVLNFLGVKHEIT